MNGAQFGFGAGIDRGDHIVRRGGFCGRLQIEERQRIGITMPQPQIALEHIADFAVFGQSAFLDQCIQLIKCLPRLCLDVLELCFVGLIDAAHGVSPFLVTRGGPC